MMKLSFELGLQFAIYINLLTPPTQIPNPLGCEITTFFRPARRWSLALSLEQWDLNPCWLMISSGVFYYPSHKLGMIIIQERGIPI